MKRKTKRTIWIAMTILALYFLADYSRNNQETSSSLIGFLELSVIVISIISFRKLAGPKKLSKAPLLTETLYNSPQAESEATKDLSLYTNINSYTVPQETYPEHSGRIGEDRIAKVLSQFGVGRRVVRNLIIGNDQATTEIDSVFITECGIYVLESKNFSGWIFGNLSQKNWTQTFPNQTKNKFFNPILQNQGHINALRYLLDKYPGIDIRSVIVFSDSATLKKVPESTNDLLILNESELYKILEASIEYNKKIRRGPTLTPDQIYRIWSLLNQYNIESFRKREKHIENVNTKKTEN